MTRHERNTFMCQLYTEGWSQPDLANRFHLSTVRIGQILAQAGLVKDDRPRLPPERTEYTATQLSFSVKEALREAVLREGHGASMSRFIANAIEAELRRRGIDIQDPVIEKVSLPSLPFEE